MQHLRLQKTAFKVVKDRFQGSQRPLSRLQKTVFKELEDGLLTFFEVHFARRK